MDAARATLAGIKRAVAQMGEGSASFLNSNGCDAALRSLLESEAGQPDSGVRAMAHGQYVIQAPAPTIPLHLAITKGDTAGVRAALAVLAAGTPAARTDMHGRRFCVPDAKPFRGTGICAMPLVAAAAQLADADVVTALLDAGFDINDTCGGSMDSSRCGFSALQIAAMFGRAGPAAVLIARGAELAPEEGLSPLKLARAHNHNAVAKMLEDAAAAAAAAV